MDMFKSASKKDMRPYEPRRKSIIRRDFSTNWPIYLMAFPVVLYFFVFNYLPMGGVLIAFQNFSIRHGIFGSQWVGLLHFQHFLESAFFGRLIRNTLLISLYGLLFSFPFPILFALCLNEIRHKKFKKLTQTISYLPYFISLVVVVAILNDFTKANGLLTKMAQTLGDSGGSLIARAEWFRTLYIGSNIWQHLGYNAIIFIAALSAIDPELYEAAVIDGAGRLKQTWHITLPGLRDTIVVLLILRIGQIMNVGYEKIILMYSPSTYETADVISSYVYRVGVTNADYSYSTAINLFNSLINFIILFAANGISRKFSSTSLW
jgi:ABC-type polysaccharide transport system, permease component